MHCSALPPSEIERESKLRDAESGWSKSLGFSCEHTVLEIILNLNNYMLWES